MVSQMYGWIDTWMDRCVSLRYRFCGKSDGWMEGVSLRYRKDGWMDGLV